MKIAIFGGRFDPIHNGHLAVAQEVLKTNSADEIWLSLENQHQWRPIVAPVKDRKNMLELAIQEVSFTPGVKGPNTPGVGKLRLDLTPIALGGSTATLFVMRALKKKFPQHEFVFVVGSDNMNVFYKWSHWKELLQEVQFLIVARKGSPTENVPPNATAIADPTYTPLDDSATRIRELIKAGQPITGLVPESVEQYIIEHRLYQ